MAMSDLLPRKILVITTGGTIEKTYDEEEGTLENRGPEIKNRLLKKLRLPYVELDIISIMAKDSLLMTESDRAFILQTIQYHLPSGRAIVVLHGTDTMTVTAEYCWKSLKDLAVPLIFTGAMRPLGMEDSDALQNVTEALLAAKILPPGVYVSFHNQIFSVPYVQKNHAKRTFESKSK
jgi:L-asparaginase